jgi:glutathione peroxidase
LTSQKQFEGFGEGERAAFMEKFLTELYGENYSDPQIKWNFTKFLIGKSGEVIGRYEPTIPPEDLAQEIEILLD